MSRFRREYGAGPAHLIVAVACLGVGGWALLMALDVLGRPENFARWFAGSILLHDLVALPLYSALGVAVAALVIGRRRTPVRIAALNHLRVPALLAGLALLVWFPLVLSKAPVTFARAAGYRPDVYMGRWLALCAVLFGASAIMFLVRLPRLRARG